MMNKISKTSEYMGHSSFKRKESEELSGLKRLKKNIKKEERVWNSRNLRKELVQCSWSSKYNSREWLKEMPKNLLGNIHKST